jgi:nicotinamide mononucleotide transporter
MTNWIATNYIEIFGAVAGIIYVFLEIRQNIWLWPVGIVTSAVYIYVFFTGKLYADMSLQGYYLAISLAGWYWWLRGSGRRAHVSSEALAKEEGSGQEGKRRGGEGEIGRGGDDEKVKGRGGEGERPGDEETKRLKVTRLKLITGIILAIVFVVLYGLMWFVLDGLTDSPVPQWDSFITSLSIVATWMLARKIYEHWFLWIIVNTSAAILFFTRGLFPTVVLYFIYLVMSFAGLKAWKHSNN